MAEDGHAAEDEANDEMKELTSTPFGLIIGYFLPGVGGLYSLSYFSSELRDILGRSLTANSNVGLVLILACAALAVGMQVNAFRWIIFQRVICRKSRLTAEDFKRLGGSVKVVDFRAAVDEYYRYHQFYGAMAIVAPTLYAEWLAHSWGLFSLFTLLCSLVTFLAIESSTIWFGLYTYLSYITLSRQILGG